MESGYSQGNNNPAGAPPHMMGGYYQGMPNNNYNINQPPGPSSSPNNSRPSNAISIWAGDLDAYMDETFLRQAVAASGWGNDITRIKVVRDHYSGAHAGYGFLDAASPDAAQRVITTGSGMPIPGTNRCWRLNMGRNAAVNAPSSAGAEINIYVGNLEPSVTDYQLMTAFRPRYASVRHAKVVCNEYGQSRGFGFVRFANPQDAERAVNEMQGFEFNQKPIRLSPANGRARSGRGGGGGGGGGGGHHHGGGYGHHGGGAGHGHHHGGGHGHHGAPPTNKRPRQLMSPDDPNNTTIFIGGTGSHITDELLWREFHTFGELDGVRVPVNKTGFAFVRFKTRECAQRAKDELSGTHITSLNPHKPVNIEWASEQIPVSRPPPMAQNSVAPMNYNSGSSQPYDPQYSSQYNANSSGMNSHPSGNMSSVYNNFPPAPNGNAGGSAGAGLSQTASGAPSTDNKANDAKPAGPDQTGATTSGKDSVTAGDGMSVVGTNGETEPPSKRAAVGRPEYAGEGGAKKDGESKPEGTSEESPAMHFSWLNASSTTPTANPQ